MGARLQTLQSIADKHAPGKTQSTRDRHRLLFHLGRYGTPRFLYGHGLGLKPPGTAKTPANAALAMAAAETKLLGLGTQDSLTVAAVRPRPSGLVTVRLQQKHAGVAVEGGSLRLTLDTALNVRSVSSTLVPDITRSPAPSLTSSAAQAQLSARRTAATIDSTRLVYRPARRFCDTADLAWRIAFHDHQEPGVAWIDAHDGSLIAESLGGPRVQGNGVGIFNSTNCAEVEQGTAAANARCADPSCPVILGSPEYEVCTGMEDLLAYWDNSALHGLHWDSYDGLGECLRCTFTFTCAGSGASVWGSDEPWAWASTEYQNKGVYAHEYGHELIKAIYVEIPAGQQYPVCEHLADMQAVAIDPQWKLTRLSGGSPCTIRDLASPGSVSATCDGEAVYFPATFDEFNTHSAWTPDGAQSRPGHYQSWHVPSTLFSHMLYNYAQMAGLDRMQAASIAYSTLRNQLDDQEDFSMLGYQFHLLLEADARGAPHDYSMPQAQQDAKLWGFAERYLEHSYTRPALTWIWNFSTKQTVIYYDKYVPSVDDRLMVAVRNHGSDQWVESDTGLSPATVSSALTAGYLYQPYGGTVLLAWRGWDSTIYYATRSVGGAFGALQTVPGAQTTHAPVIAVGEDVQGNPQARLFFRDAATGNLHMTVWGGSSWSSPGAVAFAGPVAREPAVTWDPAHGSYTILFVSGTTDAAGEVSQMEVYPSSFGDLYLLPATFHECAYSLGPHEWHGQISAAAAGGQVYLLGLRDLGGTPYDVSQAAMSRQPSGYLDFWHHGVTWRQGDGVLVASGPTGLHMIVWYWDGMTGHGSLYSK